MDELKYYKCWECRGNVVTRLPVSMPCPKVCTQCMDKKAREEREKVDEQVRVQQ